MAVPAASLPTSSALCPRESLQDTPSRFNKMRVVENRRSFNNHVKRVFLHSSLRRNSSKGPVWPRASQSSGNTVITTEKLNQEIGCLGVKVEEGEGKLPKLVLKSDGGSEAEIYLFGGCISSWNIPNGKDLLFVRPDAVFNGQKPISGGIPHCFPQFGPGPIQQHGFARNMTWSVASSGNSDGKPSVTLELKDNSYTHSMWDFSFLATYNVILDTESLSTELVIKNTDKKAFTFSAALHTYFRALVTGASVKGLKGCTSLKWRKGKLLISQDLWIVYILRHQTRFYLRMDLVIQYLLKTRIGQTLYYGILICKWKLVTKILSVLKMPR